MRVIYLFLPVSVTRNPRVFFWSCLQLCRCGAVRSGGVCVVVIVIQCGRKATRGYDDAGADRAYTHPFPPQWMVFFPSWGKRPRLRVYQVKKVPSV